MPATLEIRVKFGGLCRVKICLVGPPSLTADMLLLFLKTKFLIVYRPSNVLIYWQTVHWLLNVHDGRSLVCAGMFSATDLHAEPPYLPIFYWSFPTLHYHTFRLCVIWIGEKSLLSKCCHYRAKESRTRSGWCKLLSVDIEFHVYFRRWLSKLLHNIA